MKILEYYVHNKQINYLRVENIKKIYQITSRIQNKKLITKVIAIIISVL